MRELTGEFAWIMGGKRSIIGANLPVERLVRDAGRPGDGVNSRIRGAERRERYDLAAAEIYQRSAAAKWWHRLFIYESIEQ